MNHVLGKDRKDRKIQKLKATNFDHPPGRSYHEEKLPRSAWKIGVVKKLILGILGNDACIRGAIVRILRTKSLISRPAKKLFQVETIHDFVKRNNVSNKEIMIWMKLKLVKNKKGNVISKIIRRKKTVIGELNKKLNN